jgi:hypothetical protein
MMRKVILATLALFPLMLQAQANLPAQPQVKLGVMQTDATRVPTQLIAPKLTHTVDIVTNSMATECLQDNDCKIVVGMIVDKTGKPSNLRIIHSASEDLDSNVLASVSQYRFVPGMLHNQAVATPVNLEIVVRDSNR